MHKLGRRTSRTCGTQSMGHFQSGSKLKHQGTTDFTPCFHFPGFPFGYRRCNSFHFSGHAARRGRVADRIPADGSRHARQCHRCSVGGNRGFDPWPRGASLKRNQSAAVRAPRAARQAGGLAERLTSCLGMRKAEEAGHSVRPSAHFQDLTSGLEAVYFFCRRRISTQITRCNLQVVLLPSCGAPKTDMEEPQFGLGLFGLIQFGTLSDNPFDRK